LGNPEIPGEEIQTGRLGIRVRPGTPAAAKVLALEAHGGAELLRQVLQEQKVIDGTYTVVKPEKPLEFIGQVSTTLLTGKLGRTPMGLALEITDWQELEGTFEMEKNRLRLGFQELHVVKEWDGDREGFTAFRGMSLDRIQGSNLWVSFRRYDPLPDEGIVLPTASVEMFEAQRSVIRQLQIGSPRTGALAAELADTGWLGTPPRVPLDGKKAHHLPDPNEEQAEAVSRVMGMRPGQLYLIQGPPGTGKTTAIVESIRRILG